MKPSGRPTSQLPPEIGLERLPETLELHFPFCEIIIEAGSLSFPGTVEPRGLEVLTMARFRIIPTAHAATFIGWIS